MKKEEQETKIKKDNEDKIKIEENEA